MGLRPPRGAVAHRVAVHGDVQAPVGVTGHEPFPGPRNIGGLKHATGERAAQESDDHSSTSIPAGLPRLTP